jgi:hypothetical protein
VGRSSRGFRVEGDDPPARAMGVIGSVSGQVGHGRDDPPAHEDGELKDREWAPTRHHRGFYS